MSQPSVGWFRVPLDMAKSCDGSRKAARSDALVDLLGRWHLGGVPSIGELRRAWVWSADRVIALRREAFAWAVANGANHPDSIEIGRRPDGDRTDIGRSDVGQTPTVQEASDGDRTDIGRRPDALRARVPSPERDVDVDRENTISSASADSPPAPRTDAFAASGPSPTPTPETSEALPVEAAPRTGDVPGRGEGGCNPTAGGNPLPTTTSKPPSDHVASEHRKPLVAGNPPAYSDHAHDTPGDPGAHRRGAEPLDPPGYAPPPEKPPDRRAADVATVWGAYRGRHPKCGPTPPAALRKMIHGRLRESGVADLVSVIAWAHESDHPKATYLQDNAHLGLDNILRAEKFPARIEWASAWEAGDHASQARPGERERSQEERDYDDAMALFGEGLGPRPAPPALRLVAK